MSSCRGIMWHRRWRHPMSVTFRRLSTARKEVEEVASKMSSKPGRWRVVLGLGLTATTVAAAHHFYGPPAEIRAADAEPGDTRYLRRKHMKPRPCWQDSLVDIGFGFYNMSGIEWTGYSPWPKAWSHVEPYWNEKAAYEVTSEGMWIVEQAAFDLHSMCLEAVDDVVKSDKLLQDFGIPTELWTIVRHSWLTRQSDLLGRFDLLWDGETPPKLAEYNADTPTVLVEAGPAQANWYSEMVDLGRLPAGSGQFNNIAGALISAFEAMKREDEESESPHKFSLIVTAQAATPDLPFLEERDTAKFVHKMALQAGVNAQFCDLEEFGKQEVLEALLDAADGRTVTATSPSVAVWKLYPYEWLVHETLGVALAPPYLDGHVRFLEPAWKLVLSSKAILAYLWEKHPNHPNLLPAFYSSEELRAHTESGHAQGFSEHGDNGVHWVSKPRFGREGEGIVYSNCEMNQFESFDDFEKNANEAPKNSVPVLPEGHSLENETSGAADVTSTLRQRMEGQSDAEREGRVVAERAVNHQIDHRWGGTHTQGNGAPSLPLNVGRPVFQQYHAPARLHRRTVITSTWMIRGMPVGACFREDTAKTTNNDSCFVPHYVAPNETFNPPAGYNPSRKQQQLRVQLYGDSALEKSEEEGSRAEGSTHGGARHYYGARPGLGAGFPINRPYHRGGVGGAGTGGRTGTVYRGGGGGGAGGTGAGGKQGSFFKWWNAWTGKGDNVSKKPPPPNRPGSGSRGGPPPPPPPTGSGARSPASPPPPPPRSPHAEASARARATRGAPGSVGATGNPSPSYARAGVGSTGRSVSSHGGGGRG